MKFTKKSVIISIMISVVIYSSVATFMYMTRYNSLSILDYVKNSFLYFYLPMQSITVVIVNLIDTVRKSFEY